MNKHSEAPTAVWRPNMLKKKVIDEVGKVHCLHRCLGGSEER
jgi:hypothetical protein